MSIKDVIASGLKRIQSVARKLDSVESVVREHMSTVDLHEDMLAHAEQVKADAAAFLAERKQTFALRLATIIDANRNRAVQYRDLAKAADAAAKEASDSLKSLNSKGAK